jgi:anti-sigma factor RsiW
VLLIGMEQFSYGEAAQMLGVPVGTVMSRLARPRAAQAPHGRRKTRDDRVEGCQMKESAMTRQRPDETTLHAWVDGELQPDAAAAVAQWLAEHPEEAARMAAIQAQNAGLQALHAQLLDEPVPPRLMRSLQKPALQWRWPHALAAGLMLSVGLGLGLGYGAGQQKSASHQADTAAQLPGFVREAAAAHAVYVPEQRHPVEVAAQQQAHLVQWLSKRLGVALKPWCWRPRAFISWAGGCCLGERPGPRPVHVRGSGRPARHPVCLGAQSRDGGHLRTRLL